MIGFGKVTTGKTPKISNMQIIPNKVDKALVERVRFSSSAVLSSTFIVHEIY